MKRLLLGLLTIASIALGTKASAQYTFVHGDTVHGLYQGGLLTLHNDLINNSSNPIKVIWRVTAHDFPASWAGGNLGICDNENCYSNASGDLTNSVSFTSLDYAPNDTGLFDMQIDLSAATAGTHYMTVNFKDSANTTDQENMTFVVGKHNTGTVTVIRSDEDITLYPVPVRDELNVIFNDLAVKNIAVYNVIGKAMMVFRTSGNSAKMDINKLPAGVYFLRFSDANGQVIATKRFTKQ